MRTLAGWCVRHRRLVLLIWAVVLIVSLGLLKSVGSDYSNSFSFPHTQSSDAIALLQASAPKVSGDTEQIVFATSDGVKVTDPSVESRITEMISKIEALPHVAPVTSPYSAGGRQLHQRGQDGGVHSGDAQPTGPESHPARGQTVRGHGDVGGGGHTSKWRSPASWRSWPTGNPSAARCRE